MIPFRHGWILTLTIPAAFALSGCASTGERMAWERWEAAAPAASTTAAESSGPSPTAAPPPDPAGAVSVDDLYRYAEANNAGLRAAHESWRAELGRVPQARALPDPMAMYGYSVKPVQTREGPETMRFGLSQTFPLFGKLGLRGDMAVQDAVAAGSRFEAERRDLRYRIAANWNDYYYLGRSVALSRDNLDLLSRLESVALSSYTAGTATHAAVIQAQIELGKLENDVLTLEARQAPIVAALNADLNRPADAPIPWPHDVASTTAPADAEALRDSLLHRNPDLLAMAASVDRAEAGTRLAGRSPIPDLTLGAEYMVMGLPDEPGVPGAGEDAFAITAGISLPIWVGRYDGEKAEARARRDAAVDEKTQLTHRLLAEFDRVTFALQDADRRALLYETTLIPKAQESLNVTEKGFTAGTTDFSALIDAQRTLLEFELALESARADRATRVAELERLVGSDLAPNAGVTGGEK